MKVSLTGKNLYIEDGKIAAVTEENLPIAEELAAKKAANGK